MPAFLTLHDPKRARAYYDSGLWTSDTFYSLMVAHAARAGDAVALRSGRASLTWVELLRWVESVAAALRAAGLTTGDRVSMWLSNRVEAVVTFLACSREGFACNPSLHRAYACPEVAALLARLRAAALVTEPGWGADRDERQLDRLLADLPSLRVVWQPDDFPRRGTGSDREPSDDPDKIVYLAFTSGTTGAPKCVMHSDNTLLANARDLVADWKFDAETRLLTLSPLSHHIAWVAVGQWLVSGCQLITDDPPAGHGRLDWIVETGATYVMGVPTHAIDVLAEQKARGADRIGQVEVFYMAGAPIPPSVAETLARQGIAPQNVYGMTENSSHQYTHRDDAPEVVVGTCGRGGRAYQVRIFDPDDPDKPLGPGQVGEIGGRGATLMLGYFGNQDATEASFNREGWFLSGDLGSLDAHGNLKIEGRLKDLIIRGGHNIHPARIEAIALRHPGVHKAAAFPVPDDRLGEKACLAVAGVADGQALLAFLLAEGLSKYDMPEYFVAMEALPLTASGKILKRELVEMLNRGDIAPEPLFFRPGRAAEGMDGFEEKRKSQFKDV